MVYQGCDIGSAKPEKNILEKYPHEMIDVISPNEVFSVADFCKASHEIIKKTHSLKKLPLFVGGSMMYFKTLLDGIHELPERDKDYRAELEKLNKGNKSNYLYYLLMEKDPVYAKTINKNDEVRIIRALEIFKSQNKPLSKILKDNKKESLANNFEVSQYGIMEDRKKIHNKIEERLKMMFENGLEQEVEKLLSCYDISENHPIRKSVNYKQLLSYLNGDYDIETCFSKALYATRQLAKRQSTWLKSWDDFKKIGTKDIKILEDDFKKIISSL
tara:strand:+ start:11342 stop:12160 length:819 start_codon:yes stop_codon:yes gene_type:complete